MKWPERRLSAHAEGVFSPRHSPSQSAGRPCLSADPLEGITGPRAGFGSAPYAEYAGTIHAEHAAHGDYSPILVVEVISADTADKDLAGNRRLYLQVPSIREYWILDPREGVEGLALLVYRRQGRRRQACRTLAAGATYTTPLLPGFSLLLDPLA